MIEETLIKLARMWAEDGLLTIIVSGDGNFFTTYAVKDCVITGPEYIHISSKYSGCEHDKISNYRFCRYATWHESMHVLHTPPGLLQRMDDDNDHDPATFNLVEDWRVECLGLSTYVGYHTEHDFVYLSRFDSLNEDIDRAAYTKDMDEWPNKCYEELMYHLMSLLHYDDDIVRWPSALSIKYKEALREALANIKYFGRELKKLDVKKYSNSIFKLDNILKEIRDDLGVGKLGASFSVIQSSDQISEKAINKAASDNPIPQTIKKEYENAESSPLLSNYISNNGEVNKLQENGDVEVVTPSYDIPAYTYLKTMVSPLKQRLRRNIVRIHREMKELDEEDGPEINIEAYIEREKRLFHGERVRKPLNNILLIIDMSGSIRNVEEEYKSSAILICDIFHELGLKWGAYAFDTRGTPFMYLIKTKDEKYTKRQKARLGGLSAVGSTPLGSVIASVTDIPDYYENIIILTDGAADDPTHTRRGLTQLYRQGKNVYIIGYEVGSSHALHHQIERILHPRQKRNYWIIRRVQDFPSALLRIVEGTSK